MSTNYLSKHTLGLTQLQSGQGSPTHSAKKGSLYIDVSTSDYYKNTDGGSSWSLLITSGSTNIDTYVTGFTYNDSNKLTLSQNQGQSDINVYLNQFSGLTVNGSLLVTGDTTTKNLYTQYLYDRNNYSGSTNQILISTPGGLQWVESNPCNLIQEATTNLEYKKIHTISGFTSGSYIVKSYITSNNGVLKYGLWERTLGVITDGTTPSISIINSDFDSYYSAFTPSHIFYQPTVNNTIDVYVSGVTSENLTWNSYFDLVGQGCGLIVNTIINESTNFDSFYIQPSSTGFTWDLSGNSTNYSITLTANTTINLNNVRNGDYGTIIIKQNITGGKNIVLGTLNGGSVNHKVVNNGSGSITLTGTANSIDILSFVYDGVNVYWNVGLQYT